MSFSDLGLLSLDVRILISCWQDLRSSFELLPKDGEGFLLFLALHFPVVNYSLVLFPCLFF